MGLRGLSILITGLLGIAVGASVTLLLCRTNSSHGTQDSVLPDPFAARLGPEQTRQFHLDQAERHVTRLSERFSGTPEILLHAAAASDRARLALKSFPTSPLLIFGTQTLFAGERMIHIDAMNTGRETSQILVAYNAWGTNYLFTWNQAVDTKDEAFDVMVAVPYARVSKPQLDSATTEQKAGSGSRSQRIDGLFTEPEGKKVLLPDDETIPVFVAIADQRYGLSNAVGLRPLSMAPFTDGQPGSFVRGAPKAQSRPEAASTPERRR